MLILRKLRQSYFGYERFRKYLLYALGEVALIIVGILIALQIDNWNTAKRDRDTLQSYLNSIAKNISSDVTVLRAIRRKREDAFEKAYQASYLFMQPSMDVGEVEFAHSLLTAMRHLHVFSSSTSGYEALKSSGNLDQLKDRDIEGLLYDYYDTVSRIEQKEENYNEVLRLLWMQLLSDWPQQLREYEVADPGVLSNDRFRDLQPAYRRVFDNSICAQISSHARSVAPLISDYDRLERLGRVFVRLVESNTTEFDVAARTELQGLYDPDSGFGHPNVVEDGQVSFQAYILVSADANDLGIAGGRISPGDDPLRPDPINYRSFERVDDSVRINYEGGADWGGLWIVVGDAAVSRQSRDFSNFDKLELEIKSDTGPRTILLNLEDVDDPADGSSTRYPLQITDQWQSYEIDLAEFKTANLARLRAVLGFVFLEEAQSISIRNARYVDTD